MRNKPLYYPSNVIKTETVIKTTEWFDIPFFTGYQICCPEMIIRDMRWKDKYPNGAIVKQFTDRMHYDRIGTNYVKIVYEDNLYKAYISDLWDLVAYENLSNKSEIEKDMKLPSCFKRLVMYQNRYTKK